MRTLVHFLNNDKGSTAIEYALIAGLVSIGIIAGATDLGTILSDFFGSLAAVF